MRARSRSQAATGAPEVGVPSARLSDRRELLSSRWPRPRLGWTHPGARRRSRDASSRCSRKYRDHPRSPCSFVQQPPRPGSLADEDSDLSSRSVEGTVVAANRDIYAFTRQADAALLHPRRNCDPVVLIAGNVGSNGPPYLPTTHTTGTSERCTDLGRRAARGGHSERKQQQGEPTK